MDGHGEQPGLTPGGGAGRSENLQGGGTEEGYSGDRPTWRTPTQGGGAGRPENLTLSHTSDDRNGAFQAPPKANHDAVGAAGVFSKVTVRELLISRARLFFRS